MWCPICKNEYREGISFCPDCKTALTESLNEEAEETELLANLEEEADAKKLAAYLEYSGITAILKPDVQSGMFSVYVPKKKWKQAKKSFSAFYTVEVTAEYEQKLAKALEKEGLEKEGKSNSAAGEKARENAQSPESAGSEIAADMQQRSSFEEGAGESGTEKEHSRTTGGNIPENADAENEGISEQDGGTALAEPDASGEDDIEKALLEAVSQASKGSYVSRAEKSADYRSSGITFTVFGVLGIIVMALHWAGVFQYFSTVSAVVISVLFAAFLVIGIDSFRRAARAKEESVQEENFIRELTGWLEKNLTLENLSAADQAGASDEVNFFNRIAEFKEIITKQFGELDTGFLDQFTEEYYNNHFDKQN